MSAHPGVTGGGGCGGGAIGCEFASTLADLGASVTILEALPKILPGLDDDADRLVLTRRLLREAVLVPA